MAAALYAAALFLWAIGIFGWFGQEQDPLSAVFLVLPGLPRNLLFDSVASGGGPWIGALSPLVNIAILGGLARRFSGG